MAGYKADPMPYCTWGPESNFDLIRGISYHGQPWAPGRYLIENPDSTASGKYQMLDPTWDGIGGEAYADEAYEAAPVHQERMARRLMHTYGLGQWVNC